MPLWTGQPLAYPAVQKSGAAALCHDGYDPTATGDVLYFYDRERAAFVKLDAAFYELIRSGDLRL